MDFDDDRNRETWLNRYWRPMMSVIYSIIILFDFIIFPILNGLLSIYAEKIEYKSWDPLTLKGGGLIHFTFAAVLGIAAWTRGQEQVAKANPLGAITFDTSEPVKVNPSKPGQQVKRKKSINVEVTETAGRDDDPRVHGDLGESRPKQTPKPRPEDDD